MIHVIIVNFSKPRKNYTSYLYEKFEFNGNEQNLGINGFCVL